MKIAFFVQYSTPNGTFFRWHNLAIALHQAGHLVDVYAGDYNRSANLRTEFRDNIEYHIIPSAWTTKIFYDPNDPFTALKRLVALPAKKDYDVYHLFQPFLQAFLPWWFLKMTRGKALFVYDWDDLWFGGLFSNKQKSLRELYRVRLTQLMEKVIPLQSDAVTTCSHFLTERLPSTVMSKLIYNGFWPGEKPIKHELRKKWKLKNEHFYLAYVGKTAAEMSWIIEGVKYLQLKGEKEIRLIICGPPSEFITTFGLQHDETFDYRGELSPADAKEIAAAADLGLIPLEDTPFNQSRFPIKFFDFLSVGTPVYLSNVGEVAKLAVSINGAFIGSGSKEGWISGLAQAISSVKDRNPDIDIEALRNKFSWPALANTLADFYRTRVNKG